MDNVIEELSVRLERAIDIGRRTGAKGQSPTNIYNLAEEALSALASSNSRVVELERERDALIAGRDQALDLANRRSALLMSAEATAAEAMEVMKPFALSRLTATAPDGLDDGLVVLAHIHAKPECEEQLSTADFAAVCAFLARHTTDFGEA